MSWGHKLLELLQQHNNFWFFLIGWFWFEQYCRVVRVDSSPQLLFWFFELAVAIAPVLLHLLILRISSPQVLLHGWWYYCRSAYFSTFTFLVTIPQLISQEFPSLILVRAQQSVSYGLEVVFSSLLIILPFVLSFVVILRSDWFVFPVRLIVCADE